MPRPTGRDAAAERLRAAGFEVRDEPDGLSVYRGPVEAFIGHADAYVRDLGTWGYLVWGRNEAGRPVPDAETLVAAVQRLVPPE